MILELRVENGWIKKLESALSKLSIKIFIASIADREFEKKEKKKTPARSVRFHSVTSQQLNTFFWSFGWSRNLKLKP